jgi:hypothetical protein
LVSLISLTLFYFQKPSPKTVYTLQFDPINFSTSAEIDSINQTISFAEIEDDLTLPSLAPGRYFLEINTSGFFIVAVAQTQEVPYHFILSSNTFEIPLLFSAGFERIHHYFFLNTTQTLTIKLVNFVKINDDPLLYGVIVQSLSIKEIK